MEIPTIGQMLDVAQRVVSTAVQTAGKVLDRLTSPGDEPATHTTTATETSSVTVPVAPMSSPGGPSVAESTAPHVSEEPEFVRSSADPGAEDGAGATVRVDEPWPGYRAMTAPDITDRLVVADVATLAAVKLYEASNRKRRTVLSAADRRLASAAS